MRVVTGFGFALCLATSLFAQAPRVTGSLGSVVYPGGAPGTPGVTRTGSSVVHPGGGGIHLVTPGQNRAPAGRTGPVYAYPVFIGGPSGYYDPSYYAQQDSAPSAPVQPNVTVVMQPQAPATPIIINNYYPSPSAANPDQAQPTVEELSPTATAEPTHYLLAFKDHTIYAATAYWVDGDTLHYFTSGNTHNQASLSLVDRDLTTRLNKEAGVDVKLPASAK